MMEQTHITRNDVDFLDETTLTKRIDNYSSLSSPFSKEISFDNVESYNNLWFENEEGQLETHNFRESDVIFIRFGYDEMELKVVNSLQLQFDIDAEYPVCVEKVGIIGLIDTYMDIRIDVNGTSHIDVGIDISEVNNEDIVSLVSQSRFGIFIMFSGGLINTRINISNMIVVSEFESQLSDEIDAVRNRYASFTDGLNFEDYVKYDDLNNLPPLDDEGDVGEIHSYIDEVIGNLELDLDFEFGLSGVDDTIMIRSRIIKGSD